jgi:TonB family protein
MLFYLFYLVLLRKETYHGWNRSYLLITGILSVLAPLIKITIPSASAVSRITYIVSPVIIKANPSGNNQPWNLYDYLFFLYTFIAGYFFWKLLIRIVKLLILSVKNEKINIKGYKTVLIESGYSPYSFFKTIFLPREKLSDPAIDNIFAHEIAHASKHHSVDMIIYEFISIIQWFNPAAWLCRKELIAQHEFSADSEVISTGADRSEYKEILFAYSFRLSASPLTNNFNSLLKRRIEMLSLKKSSMAGKIKMIFTLPLAAIVVMFLGATNYSSLLATGKASIEQEPLTGTNTVSAPANQMGKTDALSNDALPNNGELQDKSTDKVYKYVEDMPQYPGGQDAIVDFISKNLTYPESAKTAKTEGRVMISFVVKEDGTLENKKVILSLSEDCDKECIRVINAMPKWTPGKLEGKPVNVEIVIPFSFKLK